VATLSLAARAQQSGKVYRLGQLSGGTAVSRIPLIAEFMHGMSDYGYIEGKNLVVEHRYAEGKFEVLPVLTRELLAWNPDVLFVSTTPASLAVKAATSTVPIVVVSVADPVGASLVASLSHPGGNVTGITNIGSELAGKRLEILKEIVPAASKVAVLINPDDPNTQIEMRDAKVAADKLGVRLEPVQRCE
jgi:putative ABC transport system substrate-binding protein